MLISQVMMSLLRGQLKVALGGVVALIRGYLDLEWMRFCLRWELV